MGLADLSYAHPLPLVCTCARETPPPRKQLERLQEARENAARSENFLQAERLKKMVKALTRGRI